MKKIGIYILSLLVIGFTACTEDFNTDVAGPQTNDPEAQQNGSFSVTLGSDFAEPVLLSTLTDDAVLTVATVTSQPEMKEGTTLSYRIAISADKDFTTSANVNTITEGDKVQVTKANLDRVMKEYFGKAPEARDVYIYTYIYINEGTSAVRYTPNQLEATITVDNKLIETAYYLSVNGILIQLSHSSEEVYDDPVFTLITEVPADSRLIFVAASGEQVGPAEDTTELEGELVTNNPGYITIEEKGFIKITLNMEEYAYTIELLEISPYLYVPGDHHEGWNLATAPALYSANMDMIYTGHMYLDGGFKFTVARNWDEGDYGIGDEDGTLTEKGGNINAPAGFYFVEVNLADMTYQLTQTQWGLIGDATPGGWDESTPMTYDRANNVWSATITLTNGGFKFRANNEWKIDVGGSMEQLIPGGDNINVTEAGTYTINLYLSNDESSYAKMTPITD